MRRAWHWVFPAGTALFAVALLVAADNPSVRIIAASALLLVAAGSALIVRGR